MISKFSHFATGLSGLPDAERRGVELASGLQEMAAQCKTSLIGGLHINSNGEISLNCSPGFNYGKRFAAYIAKHGSRTGAIHYGYNHHRQASDNWCYMNHFSVEAMLIDYFSPYDL